MHFSRLGKTKAYGTLSSLPGECSISINGYCFCSQHLMNHMNLLPLDSHGVDFSRVRMWASTGRLVQVLSPDPAVRGPADAQINSVFNKYCDIFAGQVGSPFL